MRYNAPCHHHESDAMPRGFFFDNTRCTGCRTCVLACKDYRDHDVGDAFRMVIDYEGGSWSQQDGEGGRFRPQRVRLPHLACVQPLQQPRMRAGVPHRRHAQRRVGFGVARREQVHRLRILHHGLPLPRAAYRRAAQALQQMRRMPRPRGARRAAHMRGGVPVARPRLRRGLRTARAPPRCRALHHAAAGRKRDQPEPLHPALSRCARSQGRRGRIVNRGEIGL